MAGDSGDKIGRILPKVTPGAPWERVAIIAIIALIRSISRECDECVCVRSIHLVICHQECLVGPGNRNWAAHETFTRISYIGKISMSDLTISESKKSNI